jgi:hypothetical protein
MSLIDRGEETATEMELKARGKIKAQEDKNEEDLLSDYLTAVNHYTVEIDMAMKGRIISDMAWENGQENGQVWKLPGHIQELHERVLATRALWIGYGRKGKWR